MSTTCPSSVTSLATTTVRFLSVNANLWGNGRTRLNLQDNRRAKEIGSQVKELGPCVAAIEELWSRKLAGLMHRKIGEERYKFLYADTETFNGVRGILTDLKSRSPIPLPSKMIDKLAAMVLDYLLMHHYGKNSLWKGILSLVTPSMDIQMALAQIITQYILGAETYWGAGLGYFIESGYEVVESRLILHPPKTRTGLERFTKKGSHLTIVRTTGVNKVTITMINTHLQEGETREAIWARTAQAEELDELASSFTGPVILMGDINERERLKVYTILTRRLRDAYREMHPNGSADPGYTYDSRSSKDPFARRKGVPGIVGRLDFQLFRGMEPTACVNIKLRDIKGLPPTDHEAVLGTYEVPILN